MQFLTPALAATILASNVLAHPGHDAHLEIAERAAYMKHARRDLTHCAAKMKARGLDKANAARRSALAKSARQRRSIAEDAPYMRARDLSTVLATSHLSSEDYTADTEASVLFSGNSSCILSPEVTQGPYWVAGEYVREDVTEDQEGVDLILDAQVIDVATCDPVPDVMLEIWHCNSTGVYSGIVASGNGDSSDASNINSTFLRGLQPTNDDGVAQFNTLFPGHYTGRASHIHVLAHFNGTQYSNGTYTGGYVSHVGQLFFDQDLITQVEAVSPYSTNTQEITSNSDDSIMSEEAATTDPVVEYSLLGSDVSSGIFAWVAFGIDLTSQQTLTPAATLYESGGVANSNSGVGGGSGGPGGNGTAPSGTPPSGTGALPSASASVSVSASASASATSDAAEATTTAVVDDECSA